MTSIDEAVQALYSIVDTEPYSTDKSWVKSKDFSLTQILITASKSFKLDTTLANDKDS